MKKLIIFIIALLSFISTPVYADDSIYSDSDEIGNYDANDYLPPEVSDKLNENGISIENENLLQTAFNTVWSLLKASFEAYSGKVITIFGLVLAASVIYRIIDNKPYKQIISYIITIILCLEMLTVFSMLLEDVSISLSSLGEILKAIIPAFSAVLLLGGNAFSSVASSASLGAILVLLDTILNTVLVPMVIILMLLILFEKLSPQFSEIRIVPSLKKFILSSVSFITTVMLTVISFQNILASNKDSLSGRTVKFAASNFIPVVGSAVGESLKTVGAGLKYLKTTVGGAVATAILLTVLPAIVKILILKLLLGMLSFSCGMTGCSAEKGIFESCINVLDILNGIIICITILSILITVLFITSSFALGAA